MRTTFRSLTACLGLCAFLVAPAAQAHHGIANDYQTKYDVRYNDFRTQYSRKSFRPVNKYDSGENIVTRYEPYVRSLYGSQEEYYYRTSPFTSETNFLHPHWRNQYWDGPKPVVKRFDNPLFYRYLEDLYYSGNLSGGVGPYQAVRKKNPNTRCYNYTSTRLNHGTPSRFLGCN